MSTKIVSPYIITINPDLFLVKKINKVAVFAATFFVTAF